jgi:hypothetical protein
MPSAASSDYASPLPSASTAPPTAPPQNPHIARNSRRAARRRSAGALGLVGVALVAGGCGGPPADVEPAPGATDPVCAEAMVSLPDAVAGFERRETDSQATAAWGDPSAVVLRCGVPTPGPTTEHCVTANGIDWVTSDDGEFLTLTTYGRSPAVEVLFDDTRAASSSVMVDLASAVGRIPATGGCTSTGPTQAPIPQTTVPSS